MTAVIEAVFTGLLGVVGALLAAVVSIVAGFLLQATLVKAVEDVRDGRADLSFGETLQAALPALGRVALASILAGLAIGIGLVLLIAPGPLPAHHLVPHRARHRARGSRDDGSVRAQPSSSCVGSGGRCSAPSSWCSW